MKNYPQTWPDKIIENDKSSVEKEVGKDRKLSHWTSTE